MRASEAAVEDGGEGGFGIAAVGGGVVSAVFKDEGEELPPLSPLDSPPQAGGQLRRREEGRQEHQQGRETGGEIVGDIVDVGGPAAEVSVAFGAVADHRVEGVHHLIGQHTGRTEQGEPEEGGDDAVAEVLGKGLEGCGAHLLGGELRGVAAHNACYLLTALVEGAPTPQSSGQPPSGRGAIEGEEDGADFADQRGAGEAVEDGDSVEDNAQCIMHNAQLAAHEPCEGEDEEDEGDGHDGPFRFPMRATVEPMLAEGDEASEPHDGVRQSLRVAEKKVEQPAEEEGEGVSHR